MLIFTENREGTKRYLKTVLEQAIEGSDRPALVYDMILLYQPPRG